MLGCPQTVAEPTKERRVLMEKLLLKPSEVADAISSSKSHVYQLLSEGVLPSVRYGRRSVRVPVQALRDWIARQSKGEVTAE